VQPRGNSALGLGALMVMGGLIEIAVVALEARARGRADLSDTAVERLREIAPETDPPSKLGQARA